MRIQTCVRYTDLSLEHFRPSAPVAWELVIAGYWADDGYHSGHIRYSLAQLAPGQWALEAAERHVLLDEVTEEDVAEGRLNDDQRQALWGKSLAEAQAESTTGIAAICTGASPGMSRNDVAQALYAAIDAAGGKVVEEPTQLGLLTS